MSFPILETRDLTIEYRLSGAGPSKMMTAVRSVSISIAEGEILGLVGESGSGKSSLAKAVTGLVPVSRGQIFFDGIDLVGLSGRRRRPYGAQIQMVFQDPYSSLDPSLPIGKTILEPLEVHKVGTGEERRRRVIEALRLVGLEEEHTERYPHQFSGGQRQRIAIARAIVGRPRVLICDEAVSALDVSTRNSVLNVLRRLRSELGLTMLFISHDLGVVRVLCDRAAVMLNGSIVETGPVESIYDTPESDYTRELLNAIPRLDPTHRRLRRVPE